MSRGQYAHQYEPGQTELVVPPSCAGHKPTANHVLHALSAINHRAPLRQQVLKDRCDAAGGILFAIQVSSRSRVAVLLPVTQQRDQVGVALRAGSGADPSWKSFTRLPKRTACRCAPRGTNSWPAPSAAFIWPSAALRASPQPRRCSARAWASGYRCSWKPPSSAWSSRWSASAVYSTRT